MSIEIRGAENFRAVADALRRAASTLDEELTRETMPAVTPLQAEIPASAMAVLPHGGGLNRLIAGAPVSIRRGRGAIHVITSSGHDIYNIDRGRLRHPTWGHRDRWVSQTVPPQWWRLPVTKAEPRIVDAADAGLQHILDRIR